MRSSIVAAAVAFSAAAAWSPSAHADTTKANCEVRKHGDKVKEASGTCEFSQRQGYIDLRLRNGDSYSLSPSGKGDHYKDQEGNEVERTDASAERQKFEWKHRKIIVTFGGGSSDDDERDRGRDDDRRGRGNPDAPPSDLEYLSEYRVDDSKVADEMVKHGYEYVDMSREGNRKFTKWRSKSGRCVQILVKGDRVDSVMSLRDNDCDRD